MMPLGPGPGHATMLLLSESTGRRHPRLAFSEAPHHRTNTSSKSKKTKISIQLLFATNTRRLAGFVFLRAREPVHSFRNSRRRVSETLPHHRDGTRHTSCHRPLDVEGGALIFCQCALPLRSRHTAGGDDPIRTSPLQASPARDRRTPARVPRQPGFRCNHVLSGRDRTQLTFEAHTPGPCLLVSRGGGCTA